MSTIVLITAGKRFAILLALTPTPSASRHRPIRPLGGRYVYPSHARRFLLAPISNIFLFLKTSADYILTKLTDSTHVNFSQTEHFVCTRFNFCLVRLFSILYLLVSCHLGIHRAS